MLDILFNIFFAFFMGQWEEYHTGLMNTNNGASAGLACMIPSALLCCVHSLQCPSSTIHDP